MPLPSVRRDTQKKRRLSRHELFGLVIGFSIGAASIVHATVACGSFDRTTFTLTSIWKNGVEQPLPNQRNGYIEHVYESASVIDPDSGLPTTVNAQRQVSQ